MKFMQLREVSFDQLEGTQVQYGHSGSRDMVSPCGPQSLLTCYSVSTVISVFFQNCCVEMDPKGHFCSLFSHGPGFWT